MRFIFSTAAANENTTQHDDIALIVDVNDVDESAVDITIIGLMFIARVFKH